MVKKAEMLNSIDELNLSAARKYYLKKKFGNDMKSIVKIGRQYSLRLSTSSGPVIPRGFKYEIELTKALDEAGFIRGDFDPRAWAVWRLYGSILGGSDRGLIIITEKDFVLSDFYENGPQPVVSNDDYEKVMMILKSSLSELESEVVKAFFGLNGRPINSLETLGEMFHVSPQRAKQILDKSLRRLGDKRNLCKLPAVFGFIPREDPMASIEYIEVDGKTVANPSSGIEKLDLDERIDTLLRGSGINTIQDILDHPNLKEVKYLGAWGLSEIAKQLHAVGYVEFNPF